MSHVMEHRPDCPGPAVHTSIELPSWSSSAPYAVSVCEACGSVFVTVLPAPRNSDDHR